MSPWSHDVGGTPLEGHPRGPENPGSNQGRPRWWRLTARRTLDAWTPRPPIPASPGAPAAPPRTIRRSDTDRVFAGVCGGIAEYVGIDPVLVRLGFVLAGLLGGTGFAAYLIAWLVMPAADADESAAMSALRDGRRAGGRSLVSVVRAPRPGPRHVGIALLVPEPRRPARAAAAGPRRGRGAARVAGGGPRSTSSAPTATGIDGTATSTESLPTNPWPTHRRTGRGRPDRAGPVAPWLPAASWPTTSPGRSATGRIAGARPGPSRSWAP
ncbi:MAG: PspC domain-containing protein [Acidimicrobiales bacterium]